MSNARVNVIIGRDPTVHIRSNEFRKARGRRKQWGEFENFYRTECGIIANPAIETQDSVTCLICYAKQFIPDKNRI